MPHSYPGQSGCTGTCAQGRSPCDCHLTMPPPAGTFSAAHFGDEEDPKGLIGNDAGLRWVRGCLLIVMGAILATLYWGCQA